MMDSLLSAMIATPIVGLAMDYISYLKKLKTKK